MTVYQVLALAVIGLAGVVRLGELRFSARRAAHAEREAWWPVMVGLHAAVLVGSAGHVLRVGTPPPAWLVVTALVALAGATGLRVWTLRTLGARWNVRVVDPGTIVTGGPYRTIRHPNYLAVIVEVAALPLLAGSPALALAASAVNAFVLSLRIPFEEARLAEHAEWRAALGEKPRFIPRPSRGSARRRRDGEPASGSRGGAPAGAAPAPPDLA